MKEVTYVKCFICDNVLAKDSHGCVCQGGVVHAQFGYGSCHDQMKDWGGSPPYKGEELLDRILDCDVIEAFICDKCFEAKISYFRGYKQKTEKELIVGDGFGTA